MKVSNFAAVLLRKLFSSNTKWWGSVDAETSRAAKQALLEFAGTEVRPASPMASDDNVLVQVLLRTSDSADHSPTRSSSWVQFLFRPGRGLSFSRWSSTAFRPVLCRINRVMQNLQAIWRCSEPKNARRRKIRSRENWRCSCSRAFRATSRRRSARITPRCSRYSPRALPKETQRSRAFFNARCPRLLNSPPHPPPLSAQLCRSILTGCPCQRASSGDRRPFVHRDQGGASGAPAADTTTGLER